MVARVSLSAPPLLARIVFRSLGGFSSMQLTPLSAVSRRLVPFFLLLLVVLVGSTPLHAQTGEADLKLPSLDIPFLDGAVSGPTLLKIGLGISLLALCLAS